jgi:hypothetical protein
MRLSAEHVQQPSRVGVHELVPHVVVSGGQAVHAPQVAGAASGDIPKQHRLRALLHTPRLGAQEAPSVHGLNLKQAIIVELLGGEEKGGERLALDCKLRQPLSSTTTAPFYQHPYATSPRFRNNLSISQFIHPGWCSTPGGRLLCASEPRQKADTAAHHDLASVRLG